MALLQSLPVELLYEVQLHAISPDLPCSSRRLHKVFASASVSFKVAYLYQCAHYSTEDVNLTSPASDNRIPSRLEWLLRFRICNEDVLEYLLRGMNLQGSPALPKHLFRDLHPSTAAQHPWTDQHRPLPFLRYLYSTSGLPRPNANRHDGYALVRAVAAHFVPLVRFLLAHGANPDLKNALAVKVAIRKKDLDLVRLLVEREDEATSSSVPRFKRRRLDDRVRITPELLKMAVQLDARDVVDYFTRVKGCPPNLATLKVLR